MPLSKEEIRVLISLDSNIIPDRRERLRKEFFQLVATALNVHEASQQLTYVDLNKNVSGLLQIKLNRIVDAHLHRAFEDYYQLLKLEEENGTKTNEGTA